MALNRIAIPQAVPLALTHRQALWSLVLYATKPTHPDDFNFQARGPGNQIYGYQVKMSWDCMPMSSRKNLSTTNSRGAHNPTNRSSASGFERREGKR